LGVKRRLTGLTFKIAITLATCRIGTTRNLQKSKKPKEKGYWKKKFSSVWGQKKEKGGRINVHGEGREIEDFIQGERNTPIK